MPSALDLCCMPPDKPVIERIGEPMTERVEYCILEGNPCVLFVDWEYAEDWSGTFVRVIPPDTLTAACRVDVTEFWAEVRRVQQLDGLIAGADQASG